MDQPGAPFYFFIDKYAGYDRLVQKDGTAFLQARVTKGFHYSALPAAEYLAQFGYLAFSCGLGKTVTLLSDGPVVIPRDGIPARCRETMLRCIGCRRKLRKQDKPT